MKSPYRQFPRLGLPFLFALLALTQSLAASPPGQSASSGSRLTLPSLFASGMVLQRDHPIMLWGEAAGTGADTVTASLNGHRAQGQVRDGSWSLTLPALPAGGPYALDISCGEASQKLTDIYIGDVWVLAGQSNMSFSLRGATDLSLLDSLSGHGVIRAFQQDMAGSDTPLSDPVKGAWVTERGSNTSFWSAIGYAFARAVQVHTGVPIGLIHTAIPGTSISSWVPNDTFEHSPVFAPWRKQWQAILDNPEHEQARYEAVCAAWEKEAAAAAAKGKPAPPQSLTMRFGPRGPENPRRPCAFFNARVAPFTRLAIAGIIYYQGENEATPAFTSYYADALRSMITEWRQCWHASVPFVLIQLSGFGKEDAQATWPLIREAQSEVADSVPDVLLIPSIDLGDPADIHPTRKVALGLRAGELTLGRFYSYPGAPSAVPQATSATLDGDDIVIAFKHVSGSLGAANSPARYFEIQQQNGSWIPAKKVLVQGDKVRLSGSASAKPKAVRYLWVNWPADNADLLFDGDLPVPPFQIEIGR
ncbi:hypothetical protein H5P28_06770 [Ruficoccus amylovorans]|uniref:Sialate O-acetylesterase domain-containing protein n=1 Tax=Ruficoccus amylovorans TaxID=1804625 RepID=A0A842HF75_9BACT|nr:sialate O-acetylesterase [Ruficoccus amylovorans]MBC2593961.1 hypothetical protein [Ruficoccus amylovorans]